MPIMNLEQRFPALAKYLFSNGQVKPYAVGDKSVPVELMAILGAKARVLAQFERKLRKLYESNDPGNIIEYRANLMAKYDLLNGLCRELRGMELFAMDRVGSYKRVILPFVQGYVKEYEWAGKPARDCRPRLYLVKS